MEPKVYLIEPLLERVEEYGKTSFELVKLKAVDKTADVSSTLMSRLILGAVILFFATTINIAVGLWLGDLLGKNYYGFLVVSLFYALTGIALYFMHPWIKSRVKNSIIIQMLN